MCKNSNELLVSSAGPTHKRFGGLRLVFLCGSLQQGQDGVGDYVRQLASELIRQGNYVKLIAIADKGVKKTTSQTQMQETVSIDVLRVPNHLSYRSRVPIIRQAIVNINPDWLSLQFVIFSFQPKGIPTGLRQFLSAIGDGYKWHIMFHELWLGMERNATFKHKVWGSVQLYIVKVILATLKPKVVHTQARIYQMRLLRLGLSPRLLPLFPNVSVVGQQENCYPPQKSGARETLSLVMFGTIHPGAPVELFINEVCDYGKAHQVPIVLTVVGRTGDEVKRWTRICEASGLQLNVRGELPEDEISLLLQNSDFGITTYPITLIEKSGTVAALLAHGLPVLCVSKPWIPKNSFSQDFTDIFEYKPGNLSAFFLKQKREPDSSILRRTAEKFIDDLA